MKYPLPIEFDLETLLSDYQTVLSRSDAIVLDTNILEPPIFFSKSKKHRKQDGNYLFFIAKAVDCKESSFNLMSFLRQQLDYYTRFTGLLIENAEKIYSEERLLEECKKKISGFRTIKNIWKRRGYMIDCRYRNQKQSVALHQSLIPLIEEALAKIQIVPMMPDKYLSFDQSLVYIAHHLLENADTVSILSRDSDIQRHLNLVNSVKQLPENKRIYVVGYSIDQEYNKRILSVFWSKEKSELGLPINNVFK